MSTTKTQDKAKQTVEAAVVSLHDEEQQQADIIHINLAEAQQRAAESFLDDDIDLAEIPQPVDVAVREYRLVDMTDSEGNVLLGNDEKPRKRKQPYTRIACIETFVPTEMFFETVALRKKYEGAASMSQDEQLKFFAEQVLKVWKLTEEDMTYKGLISGLDFPKIQELFKRFFDSMTRKKRRKN